MTDFTCLELLRVAAFSTWYDEFPPTDPMEKETAMIKVVYKKILKEGAKEKFLALLEEMIAKTRKEDGCITYELYN
jgi:hypothetical protein